MKIRLDGKVASNNIYRGIKLNFLSNADHSLAIVTIGDDEASKVYVNTKKKKAKECGFNYQHIQLSDTTSFGQLKKCVENLNNDECIKGIIIQRPLTESLEKYYGDEIDLLVDPSKDVDGFHPMSDFTPCTPEGIISLLDHYKVDCEGKNVVIAGRSKIVSKPLASMFMDRFNCTVTMIHSKTDEETVLKLLDNCDIFVSAIGKPYYWNSYHFRNIEKKLAVIDVGINRFYDKEFDKNVVVGDIHPSVYDLFEYYTPVPGGVGLMTVATLLSNLYENC